MFRIKQLLVLGNDGKKSEINFTKGLNIIYGQSNTGKTTILECIDYIFGSKTEPFTEETGYNLVKVKLETENGIIWIGRQLKSKKYTVESTNPYIESGIYTWSGKKSLNNLLLTLIGVDEVPQIISSQSYKHQTLSWRNIFDMSFISEERMIAKEPALTPRKMTSFTPIIMSIIYLATGNDYSDIIPEEDIDTKKIKTIAVKEFIEKEIASLTQEISEVNNECKDIDGEEIEKVLKDISQQLIRANSDMVQATQNNKKLSLEIVHLDSHLSECLVLQERYNQLREQYRSDLKRLNFIAETTVHKAERKTVKCPFCNTKVEVEDSMDYSMAAQAEYARIKLQLKDLENAILYSESDIAKTQKELESKRTEYTKSSDKIEHLLLPNTKKLQEKIKEYERILAPKIRLDTLRSRSEHMSALVLQYAGEDIEDSFNAKTQLPDDLMTWINEQLAITLSRSNFKNYANAYFDIGKMDVMVNGKPKSDYGKGFRAFLNTLTELCWVRSLINKNRHFLPLLLIDSPILSLKEEIPDSELATPHMRDGLFQELLRVQDELQIIVVENDIPKIDYGTANLIKFSGDAVQDDNKNGRYGFLDGVHN